MASTSSSNLTIESVPPTKPNDPQKIKVNGQVFNWRTIEQACAQAANASAESAYTITVRPVADENAPAQ